MTCDPLPPHLAVSSRKAQATVRMAWHQMVQRSSLHPVWQHFWAYGRWLDDPYPPKPCGSLDEEVCSITPAELREAFDQIEKHALPTLGPGPYTYKDSK